jgi:cupin superfamily acireductone dioxygenase involved in methionine salvage
MSRLRVFSETVPDTVIFESSDAAVIAEQLQAIGVGFERWAVRQILISAGEGVASLLLTRAMASSPRLLCKIREAAAAYTASLTMGS